MWERIRADGGGGVILVCVCVSVKDSNQLVHMRGDFLIYGKVGNFGKNQGW